MIRLVVFAVIAGFSFIYSSVFQPTINPERDKVIQNTVLSVLEQVHFDPKDLTDEFSSEAFDDYITSLDSRKRYFTQEDLDILEEYRYQLDDQANQGSLEFFDKSLELYNSRIDQVEKLYQELLAESFDISEAEFIELDPDKKEFPKNEEELRETWRKYLKYDVINDIEDALTRQEKAAENDGMDGDKKVEMLSITELEEKAREDVKERFDEWYKAIRKTKRSDRFEVYVNAFAHIFDPHSDYFNPKEKQDFDINMGGKLEGIGARLRPDGDKTQVVSIVPGGPAYKNGIIEVNDHIVAVQQPDEDPVDVFGMRLDDVVSMIRGKKGTHVILSVQKKDGSTIEVDIERDIVNIQESFAKSAILDLEKGPENIGYIHLPKFYSSFDGPDGNSCAADVAKEIEKLKENNVNGIILDLRNNGGGSLNDVVQMSGLFIEDGPVVQVKPRDRKAYVYKDDDPEVKYDGPLVVLINSFSASASEILAAAMQDYDRAVIVGTQSFGKGTVQRFIDLDRAVRGNTDFKPLGALKITMQKFYRVDGGSTQMRGVTPDIELPDRYSLIDVGEREYPNAMPWSEIAGLEFDQEVFEVTNKPYLRSKSVSRIANHETFQLIKDQAAWFKESRDKTTYSLSLEEYRAELDRQEERGEKFKGMMKDPLATITIKNLPQDDNAINFDESTSATNEEWIKARSKDIYLEEAMSIIGDVIAGSSYTQVTPKTDEEK